MKIGEGEECYDGYGLFDISSTLQCKEGLVCVRNSTEDYTYVCKKAYSKKGDLNYCYDDDDCPYDATCECDDNIGVSVCVPIPASSKTLWEKYKKYYGSYDDEIDFYEYLIGEYLYYDAYYYCGAYKEEIRQWGGYVSVATSTGASAVMTIFTALVALLSFF